MKRLLLTFIAVCIYSSGFAQNDIAHNEAVFESSYIQPISIIKKGEGHYFIDFGKDAFGTVSLLLKSLQSDSLVLHMGEKLSEKSTVDRNPEGSIRYQKSIVSELPVNKQFLVELPTDKRNTNHMAISLPKSFGVIMPFRYCEIENLKVPITDVEISQKVFNYKFNDDASAFTSSDTILNQIWDLCKHTIKATSFCGVYVDGDRERIPYEADAIINQLSHYSVDNEYTLAQRTNEYFIDNPTWPTEWILHTVLLFYYDYLYTGNTEFIAKNYKALKNKTLYQLEREDGLISTKSPKLTAEIIKNIGFKSPNAKITDIVDWPQSERDNYDFVAVNTVVNSFYYINLKLLSEIAAVLDKKEDSAFFYDRSIIVKNTINEKLLNKSSGLYVDGEGATHSSIHANLFPLTFGIVPKGNIKKVVSFIKSKGMACSVYGAQYLLEALYEHGEADYAIELMNATTGDRNWWNMIRTGSTMTMEAWDMKYKQNSDWGHAWGTAPANIITRYMWGITPLLPGFKKVQIKPQLSQLTFSKIKSPTIIGAINAEFKSLNNGRKLYIIDIPLGMDGEFIVVDTNYSKISLNNKKIKSVVGLIPLNPGKNRIEIRY